MSIDAACAVDYLKLNGAATITVRNVEKTIIEDIIKKKKPKEENWIELLKKPVINDSLRISMFESYRLRREYGQVIY